MKAKMIYDLNEPDEIDALRRVINADEVFSFLWELKHNFFRRYEYVEEGECEASWYTVKQDICDEINKLPFDIDDLWK